MFDLNVNVTEQQSAVLRDLALAMLQEHRHSKGAMAATILSGKLNELDPWEFRSVLAKLVKFASGNNLDVIGKIVGLAREVNHVPKVCPPETDSSFTSRLIHDLQRRNEWNGNEELIGLSLKTVLHFHPSTCAVQHDAATRKIIKIVTEEVEELEPGRTLRINDLWFVLRYACQNEIVDVGWPNRPFEEILLWRGGKPQPLTEDYVVQPDERMTIERSIPVPVDIRPASQLTGEHA